jgi:hypothetical protein
MLEEKIFFKKAIENKEPKHIVKQLFDEYETSYKKLHKPSEEHVKNHITLYFVYQDYMNRRYK